MDETGPLFQHKLNKETIQQLPSQNKSLCCILRWKFGKRI